MSGYGYIQSITAHPTDPNIVYVVTSSGYINPAGVYKSTNKGVSWTNISGNLPWIGINCIVYDKNSNEGLYVGTKTGVFYKDATMTNWMSFNNGLPNVHISELEIFYNPLNSSNNKLKAATYGRGLWETPVYCSSTPLTNTVSGTVSGMVCYNALQTITVAGGATSLTVQSGGIANMIAGQNIKYLSTTSVQSGGYMWGHIAQNGPWCPTPSMPAVIASQDGPILGVETSSFIIYPNPTTGSFILEFKGDVPVGKVTVDIFEMRGEKVFSAGIAGERKHEFSLSERPTGIYFIRVITGDKSETAKIIKQ